MPILYSAVFRGTVNLADFSTITGNFSAVAKEYLERAARNDGKFTYVVEGTTFNFFTKEGTCESEKSMSISQSSPAWLVIPNPDQSVLGGVLSSILHARH